MPTKNTQPSKTVLPERKSTNVQNYGVFKLKRQVIDNGDKINLYVSKPDSVFLAHLSIDLGVTVDECIRTMISSVQANGDPAAALRNFIPSL